MNQMSRPVVSLSQNPNKLGLSTKEKHSYSLIRAINAGMTGDWSNAGFERECSDLIEENLGVEARGFFAPLDIQRRELTAAGSTTGAELVGTDHLAGHFIDALFAESIVGQLGATFLQDLVGNADIPTMGPATFYHLAEGEDGTESTPTTGSVSLTPKTVAGAVAISYRAMKQTHPSAEAVVERILRRGAAAAIDQQIIQGTGLGNTPLGVLNTTGLNTVSVTTAGQPTWGEIVQFETAVEEDKALVGNLAYLMAPGVKGHCKGKSVDSGSGRLIWQDNLVNGYPAFSSPLMPANGVLFGNFEDLFVGLWGTLDILPDRLANAASGGVVLRVFQDYDCGIGHAGSFCKNA